MAKKIVSYLQQLKFDPKLWNTYQAKYVTQIRLVILLIISIVAIGIFGYMNIPRRLNPEIKIPIVIVSTLLPGASPLDIESLVTVPLEDKIKNVKDVDTMSSSSQDSSSVISIQFLSSVDADKARADVKSAVDSVTNLPKDAKVPSVEKLDFENQPIWTFALTTKSDQGSLMRFSDLLKKRIEELPKVDRVVLSGFDQQEVEVVLDPEKVQSYGVGLAQLSFAIQKAASAYPAGTVETSALTFSLTMDKDIVTVEDIRNTRLTLSGQDVRLGDVATVSYISKIGQNKAFLASQSQKPTPTVQFFVYKTSASNIDAAEKDVHALTDKTLNQYNGKFTFITVTNNANEIADQFSELAREFSTTIILVFLLLLIFLGLRQAVIASITVPLTFLASFGIIYALGLSLNFLTTFSFLIALGVLIDDAIVVVAAMTRYYATRRFTPAQTGVLVWKDFIVPLVSTAITTIWAFVPLLLSTGIIGEFIKTIPIVVTVTMISSTMIALLITLPLMIVFLKPSFPKRVQIFLRILGIVFLIVFVALIAPKNIFLPGVMLTFILLLFIIYKTRGAISKRANAILRRTGYFKNTPVFMKRISSRGLLDIEVISRKYMSVIDHVLVSKHGKRNTIIAILAFTLIAYLLVPLGFVKNEFFPKQDADVLYVVGELPSGTNLSTNTNEMLAVMQRVKNTEKVTYTVGETGQGFLQGMGRSNSSDAFLLTLHLATKSSSEVAEKLRKTLKDYAKAKLTVQEQSGGPPAGADIQIKILGDDLTLLDQHADKVMTYLEKQKGTTNIEKSIKPGTSKLVFVLDKEKLAENNLTIDEVALWLRTYASGFTLDTIKFDNEEKDVVFRLSTSTATPEDIGSLSVPIQQAPNEPGTPHMTLSSVPLLSLGSIKLATNPTVITREKGKRTISVTASVLPGYNAQEINKNLEKFANEGLNLPEGYTWQTGGVNEENQKSVQSILEAMVLSFILILVTMVIEFRSFRQAFIALMFIPLSISGVFYIFALTQTPLSFPALIGILALFGIVVRHAIVVIEKINDDLKEGISLRAALVDAAGNRLEPVLLTSLAAIVGLIPITISNPLWRGLGGAIIAGLLFSGAIKLFFVPVMYYLFYKNEKRSQKRAR